VQIRNDYNASQSFAVGPIPIGKTSNQQQFTQIDGRINRPLTVQLRLNGTLKDTRDGHIVPGVTLTAFHLPSTNNGTATGSCDQACDTYDTPSFRLRAELRPGFQTPASDDTGFGT